MINVGIIKSITYTRDAVWSRAVPGGTQANCRSIKLHHAEMLAIKFDTGGYINTIKECPVLSTHETLTMTNEFSGPRNSRRKNNEAKVK